MLANIVIKPLFIQRIANGMNEHTLVRSRMRVIIAISHSDCGRVARDIREFTQERSLIHANTVTRALSSRQTARNMKDFTQGKHPQSTSNLKRSVLTGKSQTEACLLDVDSSFESSEVTSHFVSSITTIIL